MIANHPDPAIDQMLHYWAETYHKGNYVFVSPKEVDAADGKKYTTVQVNTGEYDNNFTYKHYETKLLIWSMYGSLGLNFDAIQTVKSGEQLGVDRTGADIANKLLQYLLVYEYEINADGRQYRMGQNILMGSPVATILSKTVLVPTEYLDLGLKKEDFGTRYKYEFISTEKIAQRVKNKEQLKGYAQMFIIKINEEVNRLMVYDLETFEIIAWAYVTYGDIKKGTKPISSDRMQDLIRQMEKTF
jgi:hypothetical protein